MAGWYDKFLSTLSLRRATVIRFVGQHNLLLISIHALLAESDFQKLLYHFIPAAFLSTLSLRRATGGLKELSKGGIISIHALLAESDHTPPATTNPDPDFYPRSPCGERRQHLVHHNANRMISIHALGVCYRPYCGISIHALLAESDGLYANR